ncbi:MAG: phosphatase PAP2 family protein [Phycisphaerae bacterium]|nr:phosphatase PAP2 family protein [Phycisphaerae bacterium]
MTRIVTSAVEWIGGHTLVILAGLIIIVGGTWGFIELADEVAEGQTQNFDEWLLRSLRKPDDPATPIGPAWMGEIGRDLTALGGMAVLSLFTLAVVGYLWLDRRRSAMWFVLIATVGGLALSLILKASFSRPRPSIVPHLSYVHTSSFPSGHSIMSAVVYLTLGALLTRLVTKVQLKFYFLAVAALLSFLVGLSRTYMGVHYPTDVLAGWTIGLVWATLCYLVLRTLQRRGIVEE